MRDDGGANYVEREVLATDLDERCASTLWCFPFPPEVAARLVSHGTTQAALS